MGTFITVLMFRRTAFVDADDDDELDVDVEDSAVVITTVKFLLLLISFDEPSCVLDADSVSTAASGDEDDEDVGSSVVVESATAVVEGGD